MDLQNYLESMGTKAKNASRILSFEKSENKNLALKKMSQALIENKDILITENKKDIDKAKLDGMKESLIDRLLLTEKRIVDMADSLIQIASLKDPIGEITSMWKNSDDLTIGKKRVPLGVIAIIYESRPNVTVDAAGLCIKSGNSVILKGGKEAINSNLAIAKVLNQAINDILPKGTINYVNSTEREAVNILLKLNKYIDVVIPRGGASLINFVVNNSTVPVIETGVGNCHVYVDEYANLSMAEDIIINAKTQRPGVCNAIETILIHEKIAKKILPSLSKKLIDKNVEIRGCNKTQVIIPCTLACEEDYKNEFLDLILAVKIVDSLDHALNHIYKYSTKHSEAIITENYSNSQRFLNEVDAAAVYVNASTRFTDGFAFGFGGEIGISTQKLHARGPMGLNELTSSKYVIYGNGQIRK
ncbi:MAG: glutamate-5-semialdehyde dehydrogenase [Clostridiaceae bacterium]